MLFETKRNKEIEKNLFKIQITYTNGEVEIFERVISMNMVKGDIELKMRYKTTGMTALGVPSIWRWYPGSFVKRIKKEVIERWERIT